MARCLSGLHHCVLSAFSSDGGYENTECENEVHIFCLRYVYIPRINDALNKFLNAWNHHPLSSMRNLSPIQLWIAGLSRDCNEDSITDVSYIFNNYNTCFVRIHVICNYAYFHSCNMYILLLIYGIFCLFIHR